MSPEQHTLMLSQWKLWTYAIIKSQWEGMGDIKTRSMLQMSSLLHNFVLVAVSAESFDINS